MNLGGTFICDRALRSGELDVYVEYTGTAVTAVFHEQQVPHDPRAVLELTRELYARAGVTVSSPLGFNNTFTILVRRKDARRIRPPHDRRLATGDGAVGHRDSATNSFSGTMAIQGCQRCTGLRLPMRLVPWTSR